MSKRTCVVNISIESVLVEEINQVAPPKRQQRSRYIAAAVQRGLRDWAAAKQYLEDHQEEALDRTREYRAMKYRAAEEDLSRVPADPITRAMWVLCREAQAGNVEAQRIAEAIWW